MKRFSWHFNLAISLIIASGLLYALQVALYHRTDETFFYMLQDFAFVPMQVLLVTLIINSLLQNRERSVLQKKMNMVIGSFFSEVGTDLLRALSEFDSRRADTGRILKVRQDWGDREYAAARKLIQGHGFALDSQLGSLAQLKELLLSNRKFLLVLLENPNLLEHETFTDLLWAVCHLTEELWHRESLIGLPESDYAHLAGDMERAYSLLITEWLAYVQHLKADYPYILSLVLRTSPFDPQASVEIRA